MINAKNTWIFQGWIEWVESELNGGGNQAESNSKHVKTEVKTYSKLRQEVNRVKVSQNIVKTELK